MPYQTYFEAASECLILVDREGLVVQSNAAAQRLFGYGPEKLTGLPIEVLVPERFRSVHEKHRTAYMAAPRSRPMGLGLDLAARRKDGLEFAVEVSLTYAHREQEEFVICQVTDISERLVREREARKNETLRTLGSMAAGIAHDLNNPLAIILSRIELILADGPKLPDSLRADLEVVHHQAQRTSRIAQDLLSLAHQRPRAFEPTDLNKVVEDALLLINGDMARKGIQVRSTLDRHLPPVMGDPVALEQVLMNLLINAQEAMPNGGLVHIETEIHPDRPLYVRLTVADNGCGIGPETLPKVFDFFYTSKPNGSGLGLWLSRRIIHEHRGEIEVVSEPSKGATFLLTLPVAG